LTKEEIEAQWTVVPDNEGDEEDDEEDDEEEEEEEEEESMKVPATDSI